MTKAASASIAISAMMLLCAPAIGLAQSSIAGTVRDATGAVVPNATVTIAGDVMIEGGKRAGTNGQGRCEIVDLRPGAYVVAAASSGFATVRQTVVVPANMKAPADATLKAGSVAENG